MRTLIALMTVAVLVVSGCSVKSPPEQAKASPEQPKPQPRPEPPHPDNTVSGIPVNTSGSPLTEVDRQAVEQAADYWQITRIGDSHYLYKISESSVPFSNQTAVQKMLYEVRRPAIKVEPESLNEADSLNGFSWRGRVFLRGKAFRLIFLTDPAALQRWGAWSGGNDLFQVGGGAAVISAPISRYNGKWITPANATESEHTGPKFGVVKYKKVEPADIPK